MITTYACQITEDLIPQIVADAAVWNLTVTPQFDLEEAVDFDETCYAILSINTEFQYATFTTMWGTDFNNYWHFTGGHYGARPHWKTISH